MNFNAMNDTFFFPSGSPSPLIVGVTVTTVPPGARAATAAANDVFSSP